MHLRSIILPDGTLMTLIEQIFTVFICDYLLYLCML